MNVEIINTGSELLLGRVLNTHQQWLCRRLADLGHGVARQVAVPDDAGAIQTAVREALARADLIIVTGGLGPTSDDLTRELIAALLGKKLIANPTVSAHIENYFARLGRSRPAATHVEHLVPEGARVFLNQFGTAPGLALRVGRDEDGGWRIEDSAGTAPPSSILHPPSSSVATPQWLILLPGPPRELRPMFDADVAPLIQREYAAETFACRTLRTAGIGEARVQELVAAILEPLARRGLAVGYCARPGAVDVRLAAGGAGAEQIVNEGVAVAQSALGASVYGFDDDELEAVVVKALISQGKTLALAESCTGGVMASRVTDVPGASAIFPGGVVSYANAAKQNLLGVRPETLAQHGAVSAAVAGEMAAGARERFGADFALAATGIAGPGGGTPEKPVGTVFLALATAAGVETRAFLNVWDRATFKQVTATQALNWLRQKILA